MTSRPKTNKSKIKDLCVLKIQAENLNLKNLTFGADHCLEELSRRAKKICQFQLFDFEFYDYCSCLTVTHSVTCGAILVKTESGMC